MFWKCSVTRRERGQQMEMIRNLRRQLAAAKSELAKLRSQNESRYLGDSLVSWDDDDGVAIKESIKELEW